MLPPSCVVWIVSPEPSTKSPLPAYSVSGSAGSIASAPIARFGRVSNAGFQCGLADKKSYDFQIPPPETAT